MDGIEQQRPGVLTPIIAGGLEARLANSKLDIDAAVDVGDTVRFNVKFDRVGVFELVCIPHQTQGMVSTITVSN